LDFLKSARRFFPIALVALASLGSVSLTWGTKAAIFWDTDSFVQHARALLSHFIPEIGLRTPGYPLFLVFVGGQNLNYERIVGVQLFLWIVANCILFILIRRLCGNRWAAFVSALAAVTFFDLLFMANTVYSETLALLAVDAAALATAWAFTSSRSTLALVAAAVLWASATLVRPIYIVGLFVFISLIVLAGFRRFFPWRSIWVAFSAALIMLGVVSGLNYRKSKTFQLALGSGFSLLNYVGHPEIYEKIPENEARTGAVFQKLSQGDRRLVYWWDAVPELERELQYHEPGNVAKERLARSVAVRAILAVPSGYLAIWFEALCSFLEQVYVHYGLYATPESKEPQLPVGGIAYKTVQAGQDFWRYVLVWITWTSLLIPGLLLGASRFAPRIRDALGARIWAFLACWACLGAVVLASTLIEPSPGQMRYRFPVQHLHLSLFAATLVFLWRAVRGGASSREANRLN
jgi:hypothetical protein